jgi:hypothetical protein
VDERLRELARRWKASGSPEDEAAYRRELARHGGEDGEAAPPPDPPAPPKVRCQDCWEVITEDTQGPCRYHPDVCMPVGTFLGAWVETYLCCGGEEDSDGCVERAAHVPSEE